jgi:hypothetical protein
MSVGAEISETDNTGGTNEPIFAGVPAAIIGTANAGPAFVPRLLNSEDSFTEQFGTIDSSKWGTVAVRSWYTEAQDSAALVYLRVLGVGDGKKKGTNNVVTNAGFVVGEEQVHDEIDKKAYSSTTLGDFGANPYANEPTVTNAGQAAVAVITIGNDSDNTVPQNNDILTFTAGDGTNTDLDLQIKFNGAGNNDSTFQSLGGTRDADLEINIATENTPVKIANKIHSALQSLESSAVNGVDLSGYTITKDIADTNLCTVTITANAVGTAFNLAEASQTDTNNVLAFSDTDGIDALLAPAAPGRMYFLSIRWINLSFRCRLERNFRSNFTGCDSCCVRCPVATFWLVRRQ